MFHRSVFLDFIIAWCCPAQVAAACLYYSGNSCFFGSVILGFIIDAMCCAAQVAATCLYIYCRQEARPYMLIDFSDHLSINVFTLGAVYLQVCKKTCACV